MDAAVAQRRSDAVAVGDQYALEGNGGNARVSRWNSARCGQLQDPGPVHAATGVEETGLPHDAGAAPRGAGVAIERESVRMVSDRKPCVRNQSIEEHRWLAHPLRLRRLPGVFLPE